MFRTVEGVEGEGVEWEGVEGEGVGVVADETFVLNVKYVFREATDNDMID